MFSFEKDHVRLVASLAVGILCGGALMYIGLYEISGWKNSTASFGFNNLNLPTAAYSLPTRIRVPSVGIDAQFEAPLGLSDTGEIAVPKNYDKVAWYQYSPTPGETGPAVILGHVDSIDGPQVFHPLKDLKEGDRVEVEREDGSQAIFEVYDIDYYSQKRFPTEQVYGDVDGAELRLITCAGIYDHGVMKYSHNLVVYAKLVDFKVRPGQVVNVL